VSTYIIKKSSRLSDNITENDGYCGPTCDKAGVEPGKIYYDKAEAESDAIKLTNKNPVGFVVCELTRK
jgi:hypothetical protein